MNWAIRERFHENDEINYLEDFLQLAISLITTSFRHFDVHSHRVYGSEKEVFDSRCDKWQSTVYGIFLTCLKTFSSICATSETMWLAETWTTRYASRDNSMRMSIEDDAAAETFNLYDLTHVSIQCFFQNISSQRVKNCKIKGWSRPTWYLL